MSVTLTGKAEDPGPGDDDGTGMATLTMNQEKGEVCYEITISRVDAPGQPTSMRERRIRPDLRSLTLSRRSKTTRPKAASAPIKNC